MNVIGITGGIGAGKSELLAYITRKYKARVIFADQVANDLKKSGQPCYEPLVELLGANVLNESGEIDKAKMAGAIFEDKILLKKVNHLLHPKVRAFISEEIELERDLGIFDFVFVEAALLIEERYDEICDELWYIYADKDVRIKRLCESRGYSREKAQQIMEKQLDDNEFRLHCSTFIDNNGELESTYQKIDEKLEEYL